MQLNGPLMEKYREAGWAALPFGLLLLGLLWSYWSTLQVLGSRWASDPQYSHGYLVPLIAGYVLWFRREQFPSSVCALQPNWLGLPLLLAGVIIRLTGAALYFDWLDAVGLLPMLAGVVLLLWGWKAVAWAWPAIAFLFFMIRCRFVLRLRCRNRYGRSALRPARTLCRQWACPP